MWWTRQLPQDGDRGLPERVLEGVEELGEREAEQGAYPEALGALGDEEDVVLAGERAEIEPETVVLELPIEVLPLLPEPCDQLGVSVVAFGVRLVLDLAEAIDGER